MIMFWIFLAVVIIFGLYEFVFVPFKPNPYEYKTDDNGNEYVKDNTDEA
jgi:hypothetical protein